MMVIIRFLLSVSTLGISEFFFTAPLPSAPRAFIAICSLGLSEFAFRKNVKFFVVEIAILAVIGAVTGQGASSTGSNTAVTTPTEAPIYSEVPTHSPIMATATPQPLWHPATYSEYEDGLAYRWLKPSEFNCDYSGAYCFSMYWIARDGCPNGLYVELNVLDSNGTILDYTNDLVGSIGPGQKVKFKFQTFEDRAKTAQIAQVNCNW